MVLKSQFWSNSIENTFILSSPNTSSFWSLFIEKKLENVFTSYNDCIQINHYKKL